MLSYPDFKEKQIIFIESYKLKDLSFQNENLVIKEEWKISSKVSCHKIFCVFIIGNCTLTSKIIQEALEFGISIFLLKNNFAPYLTIWNETAWNYLLRKKQYLKEDTLDIAKHLIKQKTLNQVLLLKEIREKTDKLKKDIKQCEEIISKIDEIDSDSSLLWLEWNVSKLFFSNYFEKVGWYARLPRTKADITNLLMDIWYTYLFNFIDALLRLYWFDEYYWVYHKLFYQRKSLVADIMEPFRCVIDKAILKAYNLWQINRMDFIFTKWQFSIKPEFIKKYTSIFLKVILENKEDMFNFVHDYYKTFIKENNDFPTFTIK